MVMTLKRKTFVVKLWPIFFLVLCLFRPTCSIILPSVAAAVNSIVNSMLPQRSAISKDEKIVRSIGNN